jgi:hypothetical protein
VNPSLNEGPKEDGIMDTITNPDSRIKKIHNALVDMYYNPINCSKCNKYNKRNNEYFLSLSAAISNIAGI